MKQLSIKYEERVFVLLPYLSDVQIASFPRSIMFSRVACLACTTFSHIIL